MARITVRLTTIDDAGKLTALCKRSKAHWGYDADFMALSAPSLTVSSELISHNPVLVAEDAGGMLLGMASLDPLEGGTFDLLHMFVEPAAIGRGVGKALFAEIVERAKKDGATRLSVLADPHAEAFYIRMGATKIGMAPSDSIPDRLLPLLELDLRRKRET